MHAQSGEGGGRYYYVNYNLQESLTPGKTLHSHVAVAVGLRSEDMHQTLGRSVGGGWEWGVTLCE